MRGYRNLLFAVALIALLAASAPAQDVLRQLPDDTFMVIELDFRTVMKMVPPEMMNEWRQKSVSQVGFDMLGKVDSMTIGIPAEMMSGGNPDNFYGLIRGGFTLDDIKTAMQQAGKGFETVQIGALTAIRQTEHEGQDAYIASVGPGLFAVGSKVGLEKFQAVSAGGANASGNAMLGTAMADASNAGFLRVAGFFDDNMKQMMSAQMPSMGSLNTFAMIADYANDFLSLTMVMNSEDAAALEQMKMMMEQQLPMFSQMDTTGALAEIVANLKTEIVGTKMTVSTGLSKATLDSIMEQFSGMMQMAMPQ